MNEQKNHKSGQEQAIKDFMQNCLVIQRGEKDMALQAAYDVAGMNWHIAKPIKIDELMSALTEILKE